MLYLVLPFRVIGNIPLPFLLPFLVAECDPYLTAATNAITAVVF